MVRTKAVCCLRKVLWVPLCALLIPWVALPSLAFSQEIPWRPWSEEVLLDARKQGRLVLVSGASKACPWCRKMDDGTFKDQHLQNLVRESFIPVRVSLRYREEVPRRFQNLVPPSLLVLSGDGSELFSHRGYLEAHELEASLRKLVGRGSHQNVRSSDPNTLPSFELDAGESSFELQIIKARQGDSDARPWITQAIQRLDGRYDAVWGGIFSLENGASYNKFLSDQIVAIHIFLEGAQALGEDEYVRRARGTAHYVMTYLHDDNGLFEEQGELASPRVVPLEYFRLDNEERRAIGVPGVSREASPSNTALLIGALASLYGVTGEEEFLRYAEQLLDSLVARSARLKNKQSLEEAVSLTSGLLSLYSVTAERRFLEMSVRSLESARSMYRGPRADAVSAIDRASFVEVANLLARYAGDEPLRKEVQGYCANLAVGAKDGKIDPRIVQARWEVQGEPLHIVVVGSKRDVKARGLWREAIRLVHPYIRREWWDREEGPLLNADISYPLLSRPAAVVCFQKRCSLPLFTESELRAKIQEIVPPL